MHGPTNNHRMLSWLLWRERTSMPWKEEGHDYWLAPRRDETRLCTWTRSDEPKGWFIGRPTDNITWARFALSWAFLLRQTRPALTPSGCQAQSGREPNSFLAGLQQFLSFLYHLLSFIENWKSSVRQAAHATNSLIQCKSSVCQSYSYKVASDTFWESEKTPSFFF